MPPSYDVVEVSPDEFARETGAKLSRDVTKVIWAKDHDHAAKRTAKVSRPLSKHRRAPTRHLQAGAKWIKGPPRLLKAGTRLIKLPTPSWARPMPSTPMDTSSGSARARSRSAKARDLRPPKKRRISTKPSTMALKGRSKKAAKPKAAPVGNSIQYMSPKGKDYPPLQPQSLGHFLCVNDMVRASHATSTTDKQVVIFHPSVRGIYQVVWFQKPYNHTAGNPVQAQSSYLLSPTWKYNGQDTPEVMRPLRASVSIKNLNPADTRINGIAVVNTSSPVEVEWCVSTGVKLGATGFNGTPDHITEASFDKFYNMTSTSPDSKFYSANQLAGGGANEIVCYPATANSYSSYGGVQFASGGSWSDFANMWVHATYDMAMSAVVLALPETPGSANVYSLEFQTQSALRYDEGTLLGSLMKGGSGRGAQPEAAANIFNAVRAHGASINQG